MTQRIYHASAELLDEAGDVIDALTVLLTYSPDDQGTGEWGGRIELTTSDGGDWTLTRSIRLNNGEVGECSIRNVELRSGPEGHDSQQAWITGSGPPPF